MKIEKTKDNWKGRQSERVRDYLDQNVSIIDLNTGPTEFSEVWSDVINKQFDRPDNRVVDDVLGYYYDKTKNIGL